MICFMFPGQPLSHDAALPDDADFAEIAALTRARTGLDLKSFAWHDTASTEQVALQVYGTAVSLYLNRILRRQGQRPAIAAEHSMGIYAALAASGAEITFTSLELCSALSRMANDGSEMFTPGRLVYGVSVAEKKIMWLKLRAEGVELP